VPLRKLFPQERKEFHAKAQREQRQEIKDKRKTIIRNKLRTVGKNNSEKSLFNQ